MESGVPQNLLRKPACLCYLYVLNPYSLHSIRGSVFAPLSGSLAVVNNSALSVTYADPGQFDLTMYRRGG